MICPSSSVAFSQGFGKGVAEGVHVRTSSSGGVLGWTGDERDPLDHIKIHHNRCSMLLGSVPSIRKIFIAAMEAGCGPSEPCEKRWDVKISQSNYGGALKRSTGTCSLVVIEWSLGWIDYVDR